MNKNDIYKTFPLGDDHECETCGISFNRLTIDFDYESCFWQVDFSANCYDGASISSGYNKTDDIEPFIMRYSHYTDFDHAWIDEIRGYVNKIKEVCP